MSKIVPTNKSHFSAGLENSPPINGPIVNPTPNAAPISPILFAKFVLSEISPMYALATAILALNAPAKNLATRAIIRLVDIPNNVKKMVLPTKPINRIGFLPNRSDNEPQNGENKNWAAE